MPAARLRLDPSLARRLRRRSVLLVVGGFLLGTFVLLSLLNHAGCIAHRGADWRQFDRHDATVVRVIDGDTLRVRVGDRDAEVTVRLIGIDAPELRPRDGEGPEHFAQQATDYARTRAENRRVLLQLEPPRTRDRYDRLLAYAWLSESESLNLALVRDGYAYADRRFNHTYRALFEQAENEARKKRRGLWKEITEEQMPAWRRQWLSERRQ